MGLRLMHETDLKQVLSIEQQTYPFPWSYAGFVRLLDQGMAFVLEDEIHSDKVLGYACLHNIVDEVELMNFCITPEVRGQGIGQRFLHSLIERLQESKYEKIFLEVRCGNLSARHLYQKLGFEKDGVRKNYYRNQDGSKEDALLMSLSLQS